MRQSWRVEIARNAVFFQLPEMSPKLAPRCSQRAIRKSTSLEHGCLVRLFEVQTLQNAWPAQEFVRVAKTCKNVGGRGGFEEGPQRCFSMHSKPEL